MVFYFSGTGNSQLAAKQIAAELGDELVFINDCLKKGEKRRSIRNVRWYLSHRSMPGVCRRWWSSGFGR